MVVVVIAGVCTGTCDDEIGVVVDVVVVEVVDGVLLPKSTSGASG